MTVTTSLSKPVIADQSNLLGSRTPTELLWFTSPVRYADAWELQMRLHHERVMGSRTDTVLALEHQPVYTVGRRTLVSDWGGDPSAARMDGIEIHHVNRGGSVTYHGPGQLVVYPILRLTDHVRGVRAYVEQLEEAVIQCLQQSGIAGHRKEKAPGVWVTDPQEAKKIASIGIRVDRGVTMHGVALNVDMDLSPFRGITPCGLQGCQATSMAEVVGRPVSLMTVTQSLLDQLQLILALTWTGSPAPIEFPTRA
jgi:lipoyl(octanoyl) transferase